MTKKVKKKLTSAETEKKYEDFFEHTFFTNIANKAGKVADAISRIENALFKKKKKKKE
jgi:hypothetical protein